MVLRSGHARARVAALALMGTMSCSAGSPGADTQDTDVSDTDAPSLGVYEGDYTIDSAGDVEGLVGYSAVHGDLIVGDPSSPFGPTSLVGLERLREVSGSLWIRGNPALVSLDGLDSLESVGVDVRIELNSVLESIQALGHLATVGRSVFVGSNPALPTLEGLGSIEQIPANLTLDENAALVSLHGLEHLRSVGGGVWIERHHALASVEALSSLETVGGNFILNGAVLTSLAGLESLTSVDSLLLSSVDVVDLHGLEQLSAAPGGVSLTSLYQITSIAPLRHLFEGGATPGAPSSIVVDNCEHLESLEGLEGVTSLRGSLVLKRLGVTDLSGLQNLAAVGGSLTFDGNLEVVDLHGLEGLRTVGGALEIEFDLGLTSLTGLSHLGAVGGELVVVGNDSLVSLAALDALTTVGVQVRISENAKLCADAVAPLLERFPTCYCRGNGTSCPI